MLCLKIYIVGLYTLQYFRKIKLLHQKKPTINGLGQGLKTIRFELKKASSIGGEYSLALSLKTFNINIFGLTDDKLDVIGVAENHIFIFIICSYPQNISHELKYPILLPLVA